MTDEDVHAAPQAEQQSANAGIPSATTGEESAQFPAQMKLPAAYSGTVGGSVTRAFQGTGLRRPSKIPRLQKSVSVASASADQAPAESSATSKRSASSAASVASSSRETTPFSSPSRAAGRKLREPTKIASRKRTRDEMLQAVADRLFGRQQPQAARLTARQPHSEELSSQTTLDDAASVASYRCDDDEEEDRSTFGSQSLAAPVEDEDEKREQELLVARGLQQDLLRDRARLRLKISSLKDDVEVYYELLVRMEQVTMAVKNVSAAMEDGAKRQELVRLADQIQAIISAQAAPVATEETTKDQEEEEEAEEY